MLTRKAVFAMGLPVYQAGYCNLQRALRECVKLGYNRGLYGWNWDAYIVADTAIIVTGYRNLFGIEIPYAACKAIEANKDPKAALTAYLKTKPE